ncbi:MAG: 5'-nucleotidase C-terminal domain-containing protein [Firmicutes bacterium]|nr:5'-nucleotidase C-terminal domain-containing protein [Bacillota bacterium]
MKHLTILHNNDMHGDFLPEEKDGKMVGGLPLLSGYLTKARAEKENLVYAIAGDMFRGSIIDSEYMGLSTISLVNLLNPDVATIGNHEVDYGLAHLLFLDKCATFPLICANLFVTLNNQRLFDPYLNVEVGGMKILFIGILTDEVIASTKQEKVIGSFVDVEQAAKEIGIICDNYRTTSTDMTIVLSHIGLELDRKLAELLDPGFGVDFIIGGHSHTFMEEAEVVNGIPIVQAGTGTDIMGRLEIDYDENEKKIANWNWQCDEINDQVAEPDPVMSDMLYRYKDQTDAKYKRVVTRWARKLTHPSREQETEMGNLYADLMQDESSFDIMLFGSGSIRKKELGPIIEYQDMLENTPFDDVCWMLEVTGEQWRRIIKHLMRDEAWVGETEFYQFSKGVRIKYNKTTRELLELKFNGEDVTDDMRLKICVQNYHYKNFDEFFGVPLKEVEINRKPRVVAVSVNNIVEEYFSTHQGLDAHVEGRIELVE